MDRANYYETDRALAEYLLFHYCCPEDALPANVVSAGALNFLSRCVGECLQLEQLPAKARALDLGCAVGRATFELARHCVEVVGIDYSGRFITIAGHLRKNGSFLFGCIDEGDLTRPCQAVVPTDIDRTRVRFERGDAMDLPADLGGFDVVLMANLIDRLHDPRRCLNRLPDLLNRGGQLIITSPYTWQPEYTPKENWLGGFERDGKRVRTTDTLKEILAPHFQFSQSRNLPFLIREHARKFQLGVAEASVWIRK
ncbi:MAG: Methyltransferase type 11 [Pedosphaera sp.]|nr:Methyltransferase type 11 [Pedosphaera sp.]